MPFSPADLRNKVYITGGFSGGSEAFPGPRLRTAKGKKMESPELSNQQHYMLLDNTPVSFSLDPDPKNSSVVTVNFTPPGVGTQCIYLPFYANCIASAVVPRSNAQVKYFFTDSLSGCSIFIDETATGDLVVYHANAKDWSPSQSDVKKDAACDSPIGVSKMNAFHDDARTKDRPGVTPCVALFKSQYFKSVNGFDQRARTLNAGDTVAGTSVIGFQIGSGWEFWYQTWGKLKNGVTYSVLDAQKFWW